MRERVRVEEEQMKVYKIKSATEEVRRVKGKEYMLVEYQ